MRIGYPCINWTIGCKGDRTFQLKSYSEARLIETIQNNLNCLLEMLQFNVAHDILFFRITSDLVPFASHPVCTVNWQEFFKTKFAEIGQFIRIHRIRISMHPSQFIVINAKEANVFENSRKELQYHADVLNLLGLDASAKIQVHIGGVYGDKPAAMNRFLERYPLLPETIRQHLVIENDDKNYDLTDCLNISSKTGIPVLFDVFHHQIKNNGETLLEALNQSAETWHPADGLPMVDYSSQQAQAINGKHAESVDLDDFEKFITLSRPLDFDIMLEIKDKETSALKAVEFLRSDKRFIMALK